MNLPKIHRILTQTIIVATEAQKLIEAIQSSSPVAGELPTSTVG